jgi:hypothetical protein
MHPPLPRILSWRGVLPVGWWRPSVAGAILVSRLCRSCRGHAAFGKAFVGGVSASSPARTSADEVTSRLLPQPAHRSKPASLALCRGDPWDVSRQMAPPLAYPDSHPHDKWTSGCVEKPRVDLVARCAHAHTKLLGLQTLEPRQP